MSDVKHTAKPTKAQLSFLRKHNGGEMLDRWSAHKTYDFVGRCRDAGLIEILEGPNGRLQWPFWWLGTRLTEAGQAALAASGETP